MEKHYKDAGKLKKIFNRYGDYRYTECDKCGESWCNARDFIESKKFKFWSIYSKIIKVIELFHFITNLIDTTLSIIH